jgi:asparagine synthase (glutamine-hydrolysing)
MCGIAGIILKRENSYPVSEKIAVMAGALAHRGPDGEGFALAGASPVTPYYGSVQKNFSASFKYLPQQPLSASANDAFLALGHRRLSIIDLSEAGHQPMCTPDEKIWVVFNGEIYNYIELKKELQGLGHAFLTECDTEVLLAAYRQWGFDCEKRFNGMWAFCIYDREKQICFASRDRLGVKPFYYVNNDTLFAFASEQKAFVRAGITEAKIGEKALHDYLVNGRLESGEDNFFEGVKELFPGHQLVYSLKEKEVSIRKYYSVEVSSVNDGLPEAELIQKIKEQLYNNVRLRLRSDVEVGTCLSGGIDSSALSGIMHQILGKEIFCFTSVFRQQELSEERFADLAAQRIGAKHKKVEPDAESFFKDMNDLVYSQDVPIWDTSTYAQHRVMQLARENNIKVVLDGQGADELFAGYHHHFVAKWNRLFSEGKIATAIREISDSGKTIPSPFVFYAKEKIKQGTNRDLTTYRKFYKGEFIHAYDVENPVKYFGSVNEQLLNDIEKARLKSFLKCEDRCGMWHSVESRTPFADDADLTALMFSFNGDKKIKKGVSKFLLREASKDVLPKEIYERYDKKGFETPMQKWLTILMPRMLEEVKTLQLDFVDHDALNKINPANFREQKVLFKLFVLARWKTVFAQRGR